MTNLYRLLLLLCLSTTTLFAQTTYTWNVASGDWTTAASWTPARTSPATNDILVFNGSVTANAVATNIPKQTIGKLRLINNVNVRLVAGARAAATGTIARSGSTITGTSTAFNTELMVGDLIYHAAGTFTGEIVTITSATSMSVGNSGTIAAGTAFSYTSSINLSDGSNTALDLTSGSTLTLGDVSPAEPIVLRVLSGSKGSVEGTVRLLYTRNRLLAVDSASLFIKAGGYVKTDSSFSGNAFSAVGATNVVIFQAGSNYEGLVGANPFALTAPSSKVYFDKGSRYLQTTGTTPAISGRSFATFIYNTPSAVIGTQNGAGSFDSIIVQQGQFSLASSGTSSIKHLVVNGGTFNLNAIGGNVNISGNTTIAASGRVNLNGKFTTNPANVSFNGTSQQKITGAGTLRIAVTADSAIRFRVQNTSGLLLEKSLDLNAAILDMDSGALLLNNNNITIGSNTLQGRATMNKGIVTGTGTITRWYTTNATDASDSALFPVGFNGSAFPLWVFGSPSAGGSVSLTSFTASGLSTAFSSPFYDTATTAGTTVNARFGHAWVVSTANGLAGSNFKLRIGATVSANQVTDVTGMRVTLINGIAPGTLSEDGSGTVLNPTAGKTGMTAANLNNTFYIGANTSINPLPVKFINIAAQRTAKGNEISWSTASESNIMRFEVEKTVSDEGFNTIGLGRPRNTNTVSEYRILDMDGGSATYRIKAVNMDGSVEYSRTVSVVDTKVKNKSVLYPNPATDYIRLDTESAYRTIRLYNNIGKEFNVAIAGDNIDTRDLAPGIYYLHLTDNFSTEIVKFVKKD